MTCVCCVTCSGTSSCGHERHPAHKEKKRTRFGRVQQLQPGEGGVQQGIGHQPSTSQTSTQWSGAAGHQPSAKAGGAHQQQSSDWAAVANLGGSAKAAAAIESRLLPLAQQVWERQQAGQSAASGPPHGKHCMIVAFAQCGAMPSAMTDRCASLQFHCVTNAIVTKGQLCVLICLLPQSSRFT